MKALHRWLGLAVRYLVIFSFVSSLNAGTPIWSFTPDPSAPPNATVTSNGTVTVKYVVTNHSSKGRQLAILPQAGVS